MFDPKVVRDFTKSATGQDLAEDSIWPTLKAYADLARNNVNLAPGLIGIMPPPNAKEAAYNGASDEYIIGGVFNANTLAREISAIFPEDKTLDILDFGFGSTRIIRYFDRFWPQHNYSACEVNPYCIPHAKEVCPNVDARVIPHSPPSDYESESFDVIYAWSIWSHFNNAVGMAWLGELHRIMKPGGHALITVHTDTLVERYGTEPMLVDRMKKRGGKYKKIKAKYDKTGFSYWKAYPAAAQDVGIDPESFGMAFISQDYIKTHWIKYFELVRTATGSPNWQDIMVLKKV